MSRESRTDAAGEAPGRRLERYIKARWTRREGGILGLAKAIGSSSETVHSWFRGTSEPSATHLRELARVLGVSRATLVAVIDGDDAPESVNPADSAPAGLMKLLADQGAAITDLVGALEADRQSREQWHLERAGLEAQVAANRQAIDELEQTVRRLAVERLDAAESGEPPRRPAPRRRAGSGGRAGVGDGSAGS